MESFDSDSLRKRPSLANVSNHADQLSSSKEDGNFPININDNDTISENSNDLSSNKKEKLQLKREIGLLSGISLVVGTMIGAGIFVTSGNLLERAQSPGLCLTIWAACGLYTLLGAISYCEIGTLIPKSGGDYIYFLEAFGPMHKFFGPILAFVSIWVHVFLLKPAGLALLALSFANYLMTPILTAINFCPDDYLFFVLVRLVGCTCIGLLTFINCYSVTIARRVQIFFTVAKLTVIAIIIGAGIYYLGMGYTENLEIGFEGSATSFGEIARAFYGGLLAYDGWKNLNSSTEELRNPSRNLPLAVIGAVTLTTICYVLVNVSYFTVLTPQEIIASNAVAVDWANKVLGPASFIIPLGVTMSVFGSLNGAIFAYGRISHKAGKEGHFPQAFSYIHIEKKTPVFPILFNGFLGILMIIPANIGPLVDIFGFTTSLFYCAAMIGLIAMRFTRKDEHRPIKVPIIIPIIFMLCSACLALAPIISNPQIGYFYALLFILSGIIFYVPFVYYKKSLPGISGFTIFLQKILLIAPTANH